MTPSAGERKPDRSEVAARFRDLENVLIDYEAGKPNPVIDTIFTALLALKQAFLRHP